VKRFRRRGQIIPFRRPADERSPEPVHVSERLLGSRIDAVHRAVSTWLDERLKVIDEEDAVNALAEMQAQAIVVGGVARHLRDRLPESMKPWIEDNVDSFAAWLVERRH